MKTIPLKQFAPSLCLAVVTLGGPPAIHAQSLPAASTLPPADVGAHGATLEGSFAGNGSSGTFGWFQWGLSASYGNVTPAAVVSSTAATSLASALTNLIADAVYHCRAVASNQVGVVYGADTGFVTPGPALFTPASYSPFTQVGHGSGWLAFGDFNGDGLPDLACVNRVDNNLNLLLGIPEGGFTNAPGSPVATDREPMTVATADLNGDGTLDLVTADRIGNTVTVLLGDGKGGFNPAPGSPFATDAGPWGVVLGDFNGDGHLDIATANFHAASLTVLFGDGHGGFAGRTDIATPVVNIGIAAGDVNGDGNLDLVCSQAGTNTLSVFLGDGQGGLHPAPQPVLQVGSASFTVAIADVNHDGKADILSADTYNNTVTAWLGDGAGNFQPAPGSPYPVGEDPRWIQAVDLNGDGNLDVATADEAGTISVLLGDGQGGFLPDPNAPYPAGSNPNGLAILDLNGDGKPDLVCVNGGEYETGAGSLTIYLNTRGPAPLTATTGAPTFQMPTSATLSGVVASITEPVTAWIEFGGTTNYGGASPVTSLAAGYGCLPVSWAVSNLTAMATYHYRLAVAAGSGTLYGADVSFVANYAPEKVRTLSATDLFITRATLNGCVNPNGAPGTYAWFEWGADTNYGNTTAAVALDDGFTANPLNRTLPDVLAGGTTYHFRAVASNAVALAHGCDLSFQTLPSFYAFTLHGFTGGSDGVDPASALVQGDDGCFYGTTVSGGVSGYGTVFKISTAGTLTTLYPFTGSLDGGSPNGLVLGSDGDFYGTTDSGGTNDAGTVFKISAGGKLTTLYSFAGFNDGSGPSAALVQGFDGSFYGTTISGGTNGYGTVFKISAKGAFTTLYDFQGGPDGAFPAATLVQADNGDFYGTTEGYINFNFWSGGSIPGSVFRITPDGALTVLDTGGFSYSGLVQGADGDFYGTTPDGWGSVFKSSADGTLTTLHSFDGIDGNSPSALIQGFDGSFYGTTVSGGADGYGTVFKINTNGVLTTLCAFTGGVDGQYPRTGLVQGSDGNFYGTSQGGPGGDGTVFRLQPILPPVIVSGPGAHAFAAGETLVLSVGATGPSLTYQWQFNGIDIPGANNPTLDLFGITAAGAGSYTVVVSDPAGVVTSPPAAVTVGPASPPLTALTPQVLNSFTGGAGGANPSAVARGSDGSFYGTTLAGGNFVYPGTVSFGLGTVFKIDTNQTLTTLYAFGTVTNAAGSSLDGANPQAGLVQGSDGSFYGTTSGIGLLGYVRASLGTVFKITPGGALTTLYSFTGRIDGANPVAGLVAGSDGYFYGTTSTGGASGTNGTVFKISATGRLTTLHSFTGGADGANPCAALTLGGDGYLYGTTRGGGALFDSGTVFRINASGALDTLYSFTGGDDGACSQAALVRGSDGDFYGATACGGPYTEENGQGFGTLFKISAAGALTTLYSFTGGADGATPLAGLVQGADGNFYGTTYLGGVDTSGTLFQLTTSGVLTTLHTFTGGDDGGYPAAALAPGTDGTLHGTTYYGGTNNAGVVFAFNLPASSSLSAPILSAQGANLPLPTQNGVNYVLEYKNALTATSWTPTQTMAGNGLVVTFTDPGADGSSRFYRVRMVAP